MMTTEQIAGLAALNPCGGCGATHNDSRCIGCLHDFGTPESAWVRKYWPKPDAPDLAAEVLRLTATVADLNAANIALVTECARLKGRDEVLRSIADLTEISGVEFKRKHPELNKLLDDAGCENWGEALSEFAARAYLAGGAE